MAVLSTADRQRIWRGLMRYWSATQTTLGALTKADLQTAVNDTDTWIDTNASAYNLAISQPARGALTAQQKTLLFCVVALMRNGDVELLRRVLGEVD